MDNRRFDELSRRIGALALPRLPRRGLMSLLGGATLAGALHLAAEPPPAAAAKCKKEGQKCNKKKCKQKNKKCCCEGKCKKDRCKGGGGDCPTDVGSAQVWINFDGGDTFNRPWGIGTDPEGRVFVTDKDNERVLVFNENGNFVDEFGDDGEGSNNFRDPRGIGANEASNGNQRLFVADPAQDDNDDRIRRFEGDPDDPDFGDLLARLGNDTGVNPAFPYGVAVDPDNRIWVVNRDTPGQVFRFNRDGGSAVTFTPSFTSPGDDQLNDPQGIVVFEDDDGDDFVFIADTDNNRIVKFRHVSDDEEDGLQYVTEVGRADGNFGDGNREFNQPVGLAVDECGNVWIADSGNDRVQIFDRNLDDLIDSIENNNFNEPTGVALHPDGDALYVVSLLNDRVVRFNLS